MIDPQTHIEVARYHDGELDAAQKAAFEKRLAGEPQLAAELARLRELSARLVAAPRPQIGAEVLAAVHQEIDQASVEVVIARISRWCTGVAAAILVACSVILFSNTHSTQAAQTDPLSAALVVLQTPTTEATAGSPDAAVETQITTWLAGDLARSEGGRSR
jgi:anti-sigma factor RsiW